MSKKPVWKEVWYKEYETSTAVLYVIILYNEEQSVAIIAAESFKRMPVLFRDIMKPVNKAVSIQPTYTDAIEWGRELADQWRAKFVAENTITE